MALIEKLLNLEQPRIFPNHIFQSVLAEWARGSITGTQAISILSAYHGFAPGAITAADTAEAQAWVNLAPTGSQAGQKADRALWIRQQHDILQLVEIGAAGYDTPAAVRARIGLP